MTEDEAKRIVLNAANNWCDYLDENDRKDEVPPIEEAMNVFNPPKTTRILS